MAILAMNITGRMPVPRRAAAGYQQLWGLRNARERIAVPKSPEDSMRGSKWGCSLGRFPSQHGSFAGGAPVVTADSSRLANDAMAGNQKGDGIFSHGPPHGARRSRAAYPDGKIFIGNHGTHGNLEQGFPHLDLEVGPLQHQGDGLVSIALFAAKNAADVGLGQPFVLLPVRFRPG